MFAGDRMMGVCQVSSRYIIGVRRQLEGSMAVSMSLNPVCSGLAVMLFDFRNQMLPTHSGARHGVLPMTH